MYNFSKSFCAFVYELMTHFCGLDVNELLTHFCKRTIEIYQVEVKELKFKSRKLVTVYAPDISKRLNYIVHHIFDQMMGADVVLTDDPDQFRQAPDVCINYSKDHLGKGIWIVPHSLLSEQGWSFHPVELGKWQDWPCFFLQTEGDIPFDLFAASFYLLTRYEEYKDPDPDSFGRFSEKNSIAFRGNFLDIPIVDRWVEELKKMLLEYTDPSDYMPRMFRLVSTFDIDHPYLYRNKGLVKNLAGGVRDLFRGNFSLVKERLQTQLHVRPDPYLDIIRRLDALHQEYNKDYFLFIHIGPYGKYDRRTIYPQRRFYCFLRSLYGVRLGLHPSFRASFDARQIQKEKHRLEKILNREIKRNRQHFLRMQVPSTFQVLNEQDFAEDFSLAYAALPGFRAGTAIPFYFYDLQNEQAMPLLIRPTIVMDATLLSYLRMSPGDALERIKRLADDCARSGGDFTMLWHNSTLAGAEDNPWYSVFIESFLYGISLEKELSLTKN